MTSTPLGRREQNRLARHEQLMAAASEILADRGVDGLTMQAVAERTDCAVGTIYTYFASKSALLVELQISAIGTITESIELSRELWEREIDVAGLGPIEAALFRLVAFSHLFTSGGVLFPREFELLQILISSHVRPEAPEDGQRVLPHAFALIMSVAQLVDDAAELGAIDALPGEEDHTRELMLRTFVWAGGMNGALLASNATGDADWLPADLLDGRMLARQLSNELMLGWGADRACLERVSALAAQIDERGDLLRSGHRFGETVDLSD